MEEDKLLRPKEVARLLDVSRSTIYRWYWEEKLLGTKLSEGSLRIFESSVKKLIEDNR